MRTSQVLNLDELGLLLEWKVESFLYDSVSLIFLSVFL